MDEGGEQASDDTPSIEEFLDPDEYLIATEIGESADIGIATKGNGHFGGWGYLTSTRFLFVIEDQTEPWFRIRRDEMVGMKYRISCLRHGGS